MISETAFGQAAATIGCEVAVIKAVAKIESAGAGFDSSGKLKVLFEPHIFWQQLLIKKINPERYAATYKDVLYAQYKQDHGSYNVQWDKLNRARQINEEAAMKSASYGMFQIMGFNHEAAGFNTVADMVVAFNTGEDAQLQGFVKFIQSNKLHVALQQKDFTTFAKKYNGPSYALNAYDTKMQTYYLQIKNKS
ncbi:N-acetylmuramidase family protein [Chitinophaga sp. Cy-1792]|uniref:N-acetylmuramidase family protein n=1 Tax=Chitinophaga sp. Cy-1792 TaxID=2608339 RepID=UPI0014225AE0|nr:N-acetylmuramidase family protein [Chitinophaga sp. Cy-1792]NIG54734.1 N-acetylmuramidase family protein [Chitinophaga sp. Cy-1792]